MSFHRHEEGNRGLAAPLFVVVFVLAIPRDAAAPDVFPATVHKTESMMGYETTGEWLAAMRHRKKSADFGSQLGTVGSMSFGAAQAEHVVDDFEET